MNTDLAQVDQVREQLRLALLKAADDQVREALTASLQLLDAFAEAWPDDQSSRYAGSLAYTFEDEDYEPHGRQIDLRICYDWNDYDPADEPFALWGPQIADVEVLAVRYLDEDGNEVPASRHYTELAWDLLDKHQEEMIEACTEHGYQNDVGKAPATYSRQRSTSRSASTRNSEFVPRLAPSESTRASAHELTRQRDHRQLG